MISAYERTVGSVLELRGAKACMVVSANEDALGDRVPVDAAVVTRARAIARELLAGSGDRRTDTVLDCKVVSRRFDAVVLTAIGDATLDEGDVHRKLNVIAIRAQVTAGRTPPSALAIAIREAYTRHAGPLGDRVFDRALEDLGTSGKRLVTSTARAFGETLARNLTPPANLNFLHALDSLLQNWPSESDAPGASSSSRVIAANVLGS